MSFKYVSQLFQPIITIPKNAKIKNTEITCRSQKLLLECGLIRPSSSGLFTILPLARRALDKLEKLIVTVLEDVGAQRVSFPTLTSASLWEKTGRLDGGGAELMKVEDRHGKKYLLSPTHEEAVADLLADVGPLSHKQLPLLIYQVGHTFILDTKYSEPLRAHFVPSSGPATPLIMSCYGIGVTRLLAACVEVFSTEQSLRWPRAIAPYSIMIIGPKEGSSEWSAGAERAERAARLLARRADVLLDDRHRLTVGRRLLAAHRMGYPCIVVCGKSTLEQPPKYEVYSPGQEQPRLMTIEQLDQELEETYNEDLLDENDC